MNTITLKLPEALDRDVRAAAERAHVSKSELVRLALAAYLRQRGDRAEPVSVLDAVDDLVGCFHGGPSDLASNPAHLRDFGRV